ncbi:MAG: hypothetical protein ACJATT_005714, partial [Myxococcota bacterium]
QGIAKPGDVVLVVVQVWVGDDSEAKRVGGDGGGLGAGVCGGGCPRMLRARGGVEVACGSVV